MDLESIKELRERTNVSLGLCKKALDEAVTVDEAIILLQKWGKLRAAKAAKEETKEGMVYTYTHHNNKVACILEVNCQTESGALSEEFKQFCEVVALQIVAMEPKYVSINDIDEDVLEKQKEIFTAQIPDKVPDEKKPHILNGKMKKWFAEVCLLNQKAVASEEGKAVEQLRQDLVSKIVENVVVKRFIRWELGQ